MNDVPLDETASGPSNDDLSDDAVLGLVSSALAQSDPVPERILAGARAAFTWRTIDAELASLVFDSSQDLAGVRGAAVDTHERQLTFRTDDGEREIEVMLLDDGSGGGRRLVGQIIPPAETTVRMTSGDDETAVRSDSLGRFTFDDVPASPVQLSVEGDGDGDGPEFATDWTLF